MRKKLIIAGSSAGVLVVALGLFLPILIPGKGPHVLAALGEEGELTAYVDDVEGSWEYLKESGLFESKEWKALSRTEPVAGALEEMEAASLWPDPSGCLRLLSGGAGFAARDEGFVVAAKVGLLASLADTFAPLFADIESVERQGVSARSVPAGAARLFYAFLGDLLVASPSGASLFDASNRAARFGSLESSLDACVSFDVSRSKTESLFYAIGLPYPAQRMAFEAERTAGGLSVRGLVSWGAGKGARYPFRARAALAPRRPGVVRLVPERAYFTWWSFDPVSLWAWQMLVMTPARDRAAHRLSGDWFLRRIRPLLSGEFAMALVEQEAKSKERSYPCFLGIFRSNDPGALSKALEEFLRMRMNGVVDCTSSARPQAPYAVREPGGGFTFIIDTSRPLSGYEPACAVIGDCLVYMSSASFVSELRGISLGEKPGLSPPDKRLAGWLVWKGTRDWGQLRDFCEYLVEVFGSAGGAESATVDYPMLLNASAAALKLVSSVELECVYVPEGLSSTARVVFR